MFRRLINRTEEESRAGEGACLFTRLTVFDSLFPLLSLFLLLSPFHLLCCVCCVLFFKYS